MTPTDCPHFEGCNAAVCPLEPEQGAHLSEDAVCRVAREVVKACGVEHATRTAGQEVTQAVIRALPEVRERWPLIARRLERAAKSPIKAGGALPRPSNRPAGAPHGVTAGMTTFDPSPPTLDGRSGPDTVGVTIPGSGLVRLLSRRSVRRRAAARF